jgi:predicted RNase H-like nuclease (RuvC/YqgF family)
MKVGRMYKGETMEKVERKKVYKILDDQEKTIKSLEEEKETLQEIIEVLRRENRALQQRIKEKKTT